MSAKFKLIVGLGNPTAQYEKTRHNAGFWFLDEIAATRRVSFHQEQRFHGWAARLDVDGTPVHLLKPMTYMNRSGQAVGAVAKYFKIAPDEILVVHDELDIPPGTVRLKYGGGHGGHNGLRDLITHLGSADFYRLRLGIGHPGDRAAVIGYVLDAPSASENELIRGAIARAIGFLSDILSGELDPVMNRLHGGAGSKSKNN
ncbi:aminoacyl-tRNA hydrolase [Methylomagnum sp.]